MALLMAVLSSLLVAVGATPRCSIRSWHYGPSTKHLVVLAVATGDTFHVEANTRVLGQDVEMGGISVVGYQFSAIEAIGGTGQVIKGDLFLAVPWEYDAACDPLVWKGRTWVEAGDTVVFASSNLPNGQPKRLDVLGWHSPYPTGEFLRFRSGTPVPTDRAEWLSPRAYYELLKGLPAPEENLEPRDERNQIEAHYQAGDPRWSSTYPGTEILRRVREKVGG